MAREKEFDEIEALEAASRVFCDKGYEGTSLQDLEKAMGLNRTSIYNAFGNKRCVFNRVLIQFVECGRQRWQGVLDEAETAREGISNLLHKVVDLNYGPEPQSCLITLSLMERSQHNGASQELIEQAMHAFKKLIQKRLEKAKK
nr:TetR family transcriptional regulator [Nitrospinaceae bacterium]